MTNRVSVRELRTGVQMMEIEPENDVCEECGASTANVPSDMWWGEQDGIYVVCQECGHTTFFAVELDARDVGGE